MLTPNDIREQYENLAIAASHNAKAEARRIYLYGVLRLIVFLLGVTAVIYYWEQSATVIAGIVLLAFIPFAIFMRLQARAAQWKVKMELVKRVNEEELKALDGDSSAFGEGNEYVNSAHEYSYDLDLFGDRSLYQYLNRTCTPMGRQLLADWLNNPPADQDNINTRQEQVKSLVDELFFRQNYRVQALLNEGELANTEELERWVNTPSVFINNPFYRVLPLLVLLLNVSGVVLAFTGIISWSIYLLEFSLCVLPSFLFTQKISRIQAGFDRKLSSLATYATLSRMAASALRLDKSAFIALTQVSRMIRALDLRYNVFVSLLLNGFCFWELRQVMRIELWRNTYRDSMMSWIERIGLADVLCSLATFAYNHPEYAYPTVLDPSDPFCFSAEGLKHPLMKPEQCVPNDLKMKGSPAFFIVTGANMAGKSTYLRTIGVNYLLALIGAPICGTRMVITPVHLVTGMRTGDSLADNESYFFAELKRLKSIIERLQAGEKLFIILDEILKGTNSVDKQKGSLALIRQFMELQANGIIATHDLMLGTLADTFPKQIKNYCFEADIKDDELTFSYHLREGIAQNMNACFLMGKMGIVGVCQP